MSFGRDGGRIDSFDDHLTFVHLSGRHLDIDNYPAQIINNSMLLVSGFKPTIAGIGRHRGIGVGDANLLVPAALTTFFLSLLVRRPVAIGLLYRIDMPHGQTLPTHIGPDQ